ncbi:MarR family winged helix-turn-helix transcriptional regulator [Conexibacter sp. SYSU D00693]|uniref:MarR family winged helix-turn-helix transcriptional regulator n=1 Tax=Conexibacter sp. SYSU D00693 TaxID=2812560 RepID=UPI001F120727|nr:MarR family transcriptional regulator [Conexibacter sp. SYSU D00693]
MSPPLPFDPIDEAGRQWDTHWGSDATAAMRAVTSIMRAHQILLGRLNDELRPWGLTFPRYEALLLLHYSRNGALPLGKMGTRLQVHRASVTNVVDRLVADGLVERRPHDQDRRTTLAAITEEGRRVAVQSTEALNAAGFGIAPLGDREADEVFRLLRGLRAQAGDFQD